eukprot:s4267_g1.t1
MPITPRASCRMRPCRLPRDTKENNLPSLPRLKQTPEQVPVDVPRRVSFQTRKTQSMGGQSGPEAPASQSIWKAVMGLPARLFRSSAKVKPTLPRKHRRGHLEPDVFDCLDEVSESSGWPELASLAFMYLRKDVERQKLHLQGLTISIHQSMLTNVMCRLAVLADKQNAPRPQLRFLGRGFFLILTRRQKLLLWDLLGLQPGWSAPFFLHSCLAVLAA